jgi:hypothetical protein
VCRALHIILASMVQASLERRNTRNFYGRTQHRHDGTSVTSYTEFRGRSPVRPIPHRDMSGAVQQPSGTWNRLVAARFDLLDVQTTEDIPAHKR